MANYQQKKEQIRSEAIDWQNSFADRNYTYGELVAAQDYFESMGRRYELLTEFRENGIC